MVHSVLPVYRSKVKNFSCCCLKLTWLLPSSPCPPSCHSAKPQHYNLLHLASAQWHLVAVQQFLSPAHSSSHALAHAENLKLHSLHLTLGAKCVHILSPSMRMPALPSLSTRLPALLQYRVL